MAGKPASERTTARDETLKKNRPLTPKQQHFARCVASGMTQSQAYREAYDVKPDSKSETIWARASELMADSRVRERVDRLIGQIEARIAADAASDAEYVRQQLRKLSQSAGPTDANKLKALELLGRSAAVFTDVIDDKRQNRRSADQLADELASKLEQLLVSPEEPPVTPEEPEETAGPLH